MCIGHAKKRAHYPNMYVFIETCVMGKEGEVMKMGNIGPRAGFELTSLAITLPNFPNVNIISMPTYLHSFLLERTVQTTMPFPLALQLQ